MNIYVGNLSYEVEEEELRTAFEVFGQVESARVIKHMATGRSKGFGFVEMASASDGETAIKALDGTMLKGRAIRVNVARPRSEDRWGGARRSGSRRPY